MTTQRSEVEPPKLRELIARCFELGYPEPDIELGSGAPLGETVAVPMVQIQLHSNQRGLRNVVAHCRIPLVGGTPSQRERLAIRSALAEALRLVETQGVSSG